MIEQTYAHVVPQVAPDLSFANMGRKWGGLGRFTPNGDADESSQVVDCADERNGDPGAIRTRDFQLRRLATKLAQVSVMEMISRNAVPTN